MLLKTLKENVEIIEKNVAQSAKKANRSRKSVNLICVSKSVDVKTTQQILDLGISQLAENRVEKLLEKKALLHHNKPVTWHFIGNLQRRKVKKIINEIDYFHALDSISLAEEINKRAKQPINCFVQVNVSGEQTKQGLDPNDVELFIHSLENLDKVKVVGLMTMAPVNCEEETLRHIFDRLSDLKRFIEKQKLLFAPCTELSMGMSGDYQIAIEEGATFIRVGSSFFNNDHKEVEDE